MRQRKVLSIMIIALFSIAIGCSRTGEDDDSSKRVYQFNKSGTYSTSFNLFNLVKPTKAYADTSSFRKAIYNEDNQVRKIESWNGGTYEGYWTYNFEDTTFPDKVSGRTYRQAGTDFLLSETSYTYNSNGNLEKYVKTSYSISHSNVSIAIHDYTYDSFQRLILCESYSEQEGVRVDKERWVYVYEGETNRVKHIYYTYGFSSTPRTDRAECTYPDGYTVEKTIYAYATEGDPTSGTYSDVRIFTYDDQGRIIKWETVEGKWGNTYTYAMEEGESADPKEWTEWYMLGDSISTELDAPM